MGSVPLIPHNPVQIAEWTDEIRRTKLGAPGDKVVTLAADCCISKSRVLQFLALLRIPAHLRVQLKQMTGLTEGELRPLTKMDARRQSTAVGRLLGTGMTAKAG